MKKRILALSLALTLCLGLTAPVFATGEFSDVSASHYAHDSIQTAAAKGITSGYSDGTFKPNNPVTRAQFVVMFARAFFPEDLMACEVEAKSKGMPWYWGGVLVLQKLHNNSRSTYISERESAVWKRDANIPITRQTMATWLYDLLVYRGIKPSYEEQQIAAAKLSDTYGNYQANSICYLGIITGYADGTFGGDKAMNRAQACVVIDRTAKLIGYAADRPATVEVKKVPNIYSGEVSGVPTDGWTCWTVADNNYPDGLLNNGKPITQENVMAMLAEAETIWPEGIHWGGDVTGYELDNNYYYRGGVSDSMSAAGVIQTAAMTAGGVGGAATDLGCGGFACMLSDYVFGKQNNKPRRLTDNTQVRPGDIVIILQKGNGYAVVSHVCIAMSTIGTTLGGHPGIKTADGNNGGMVTWVNYNNYPVRVDTFQGGQNNAYEIQKLIYTRYPE